MTQWVEDPTGGRARGIRPLLRAWGEILIRPRRFFRTGVAPGDQAPGLTFAMAVVGVEEATRFLLVPDALPTIAGGQIGSFAISLGVAVFLVTPAALHLVSGLQTLLLIGLTSDRGGVSETVQVLAYASAPCALAGVPLPTLRVACCAYGAGLFLAGLRDVHGLSNVRATVAGAVPAAIVFGYAFRGFGAAADLLANVGLELAIPL